MRITQEGNHGKGPNGDYGKAEEAFRNKIGDPTWKPDYTKFSWHHHENGETMVLIDRRIHDKTIGGISHVGGISNNPNL